MTGRNTTPMIGCFPPWIERVELVERTKGKGGKGFKCRDAGGELGGGEVKRPVRPDVPHSMNLQSASLGWQWQGAVSPPLPTRPFPRRSPPRHCSCHPSSKCACSSPPSWCSQSLLRSVGSGSSGCFSQPRIDLGPKTSPPEAERADRKGERRGIRRREAGREREGRRSPYPPFDGPPRSETSQPGALPCARSCCACMTSPSLTLLPGVPVPLHSSPSLVLPPEASLPVRATRPPSPRPLQAQTLPESPCCSCLRMIKQNRDPQQNRSVPMQ